MLFTYVKINKKQINILLFPTRVRKMNIYKIFSEMLIALVLGEKS